MIEKTIKWGYYWLVEHSGLGAEKKDIKIKPKGKPKPLARFHSSLPNT
jgi:hypothetical protein